MKTFFLIVRISPFSLLDAKNIIFYINKLLNYLLKDMIYFFKFKNCNAFAYVVLQILIS